jgi:hypothetical protein
MFTFNGRDAHRALPATKVHLPFHRSIGEILPERHKTEDDEVRCFICPHHSRTDPTFNRLNPPYNVYPHPVFAGLGLVLMLSSRVSYLR